MERVDKVESKEVKNKRRKNRNRKPLTGYKLRDALDQPTLDKLYGLKRRLERGKIKELNNK